MAMRRWSAGLVPARRRERIFECSKPALEGRKPLRYGVKCWSSHP